MKLISKSLLAGLALLPTVMQADISKYSLGNIQVRPQFSSSVGIEQTTNASRSEGGPSDVILTGNVNATWGKQTQESGNSLVGSVGIGYNKYISESQLSGVSMQGSLNGHFEGSKVKDTLSAKLSYAKAPVGTFFNTGETVGQFQTAIDNKANLHVTHKTDLFAKLSYNSSTFDSSQFQDRSRIQANVGLEYDFSDKTRIGLSGKIGNEKTQNQSSSLSGVDADVTWKPSEKTSVTIGAGMDTFNSGSYPHYSVQATQALGQKWSTSLFANRATRFSVLAGQNTSQTTQYGGSLQFVPNDRLSFRASASHLRRVLDSREDTGYNAELSAVKKLGRSSELSIGTRFEELTSSIGRSYDALVSFIKYNFSF